MKYQKQNNDRLRIYRWLKGMIVVFLSFSMIHSIFTLFKKKKNISKSKMLTQDGLLVEIDPRAIVKSKQKIQAAEIYNWVKK